jgi:hypothetical protein
MDTPGTFRRMVGTVPLHKFAGWAINGFIISRKVLRSEKWKMGGTLRGRQCWGRRGRESAGPLFVAGAVF